MSLEKCIIQEGYYGNACSFEDLSIAVKQLTATSEKQLEEMKNERWFHRLFNMVTLSSKSNLHMAEQITTLAQAQTILIEILVRLSDVDSQISDLVRQSSMDIHKLAENDIYLLDRVNKLEDIYFLGVKETENINNLGKVERQILSGFLFHLCDKYDAISEDQKKYANALLDYLNEEATLENISHALASLDGATKKKILNCLLTYMYLYDHTAEAMEQPEVIDFIDEFDIGRKSVASMMHQIVNIDKLRGVDGFIQRYHVMKPEVEFEVNFSEELVVPQSTEENNQNPETSSVEEITISNILHITAEQTVEYQNKIIHFSAPIKCDGTMIFESCEIHYGEADVPGEVELSSGAFLTMRDCTVKCHSYNKRYFIDAVRCVSEISFANCQFENCSYFVRSYHNIKVQNCTIQAPGNEFINNQYAIHNSCSLGISGSTFSLISSNNEGTANGVIINGSDVHFENNVITGDMAANRENIDEIRDSFKSNSTLLCVESGEICHTTFSNVSNLIKCDGTSKLTISCSLFTNSFDLMNGYLSRCIISVADCNFVECSEIGIALSKGSRFTGCQFISCYNDLLSSGFRGGVTIEYCEFIDWIGRRARIDCDLFRNSVYGILSLSSLLRFERSSDSDSAENRVIKCIFNGIQAHKSFVISSQAHKKVETVTTVDSCTFLNCITERTSGKIIKEFDTYSTLFGKEKTIRVTHIYSCLGLGRVNCGEFINPPIMIRECNATGERIGAFLI